MTTRPVPGPSSARLHSACRASTEAADIGRPSSIRSATSSLNPVALTIGLTILDSPLDQCRFDRGAGPHGHQDAEVARADHVLVDEPLEGEQERTAGHVAVVAQDA